ncbi:hypothetical protein ACFL3M_03400, partial [Patescibacteria group bacterium]
MEKGNPSLVLSFEKRRRRVVEYLLYIFVFMLPWQTVFLVREIFVDSEKWQYGTVGVYVSDLILIILLGLVVMDKVIKRKEACSLEIKSKKNVTCHFDRIRQLAEKWRNLNLNIVTCIRNGEISAPPLKLSATRGRLRFVRASLNFARDDKVSWSAGLFLLWVALSVFWADDRMLAAYFSFKVFLGAGLFFASQKIKVDFRKLIFVLLLSAVIQAGLGTWQYLGQETFSSKWLGMSEYVSSDGGVSVLENETGR